MKGQNEKKNCVWKITKSCISDQAFHTRWQLMHEPILPNKDILICVYFDMYMYLKKNFRTMDDKCMYFKKLQINSIKLLWQYSEDMQKKTSIKQDTVINKIVTYFLKNLFRCRSNIFVHRVEDNPTYNIRKLVWDFVLCIYCKIWRINIKSVCLFFSIR